MPTDDIVACKANNDIIVCAFSRYRVDGTLYFSQRNDVAFWKQWKFKLLRNDQLTVPVN